MSANRSILHIDMDAFYASVEQLDHPEFRHRPVIVGADPKDGKGRGVVAACSYEARRFGIHSALPITKAWRRCPDAVYVRPRMGRYVEVSERIFGILHRYTDLVEPLSIDEAFLDVTGSACLFGEAQGIGREILAAIRAEEGLPASIGVGPNKFVAKIASDLEKPEGFVVVEPSGVRDFLAILPISRLWGVGPKTGLQLRKVGIRTIGDIARRPLTDLKALLGEVGEQLWRLSWGVDDRPVVPEKEEKSLGAEMTFGEDTDNSRQIHRTLLALSERVAARLRRRGALAEGVTLKFRDESFATLTRSCSLPHPSDLAEDLYRGVLRLLERLEWKGKKVRLLGVTGIRLVARGESCSAQLDLFSCDADGRRDRLARTVDDIRDRFGSQAIVRAAMIDQEDPSDT